MPSESKPWGYAAALLGAVFVGTGNVAAKLALDGGMLPLHFAAVGALLAAALMLPFVRRFRRPQGADAWRMLAAAVAGNICAPILLVLGLASTSGVTAALMVDLELVFTAALAFLFLHERSSALETTALATIGIGGVVVSIGNGIAQGGGGSWLGTALIGLGILAFSIDNTLSTPLVQRHDIRGMSSVRLLAGALAISLVALVVDGWPSVPRGAWAPLGYQAALTIDANVLLFYAALRAIGATRSVVVMASAGLWGALAGWLVLREGLTLFQLAGAAMMALGAVGLWMAARSSTRAQARERSTRGERATR